MSLVAGIPCRMLPATCHLFALSQDVGYDLPSVFFRVRYEHRLENADDAD